MERDAGAGKFLITSRQQSCTVMLRFTFSPRIEKRFKLVYFVIVGDKLVWCRLEVKLINNNLVFCGYFQNNNTYNTIFVRIVSIPYGSR